MQRLDVGRGAVEEAAALLSGDERVRASRFSGAGARQRFTVARAALRRQIGERLRVPPEDVEFAYGPYGKPRLGGFLGDADLRFSVSHCDEIAAFAFAAGRDVGVDIEAVRAVPQADAIAADLCSPAEWRAYRSLEERRKPQGFLCWWTRREAFVKAHGGGLGHPLAAGDPSGSGWAVREFLPGPGLVGAVAFARGHEVEGEALVVRD